MSAPRWAVFTKTTYKKHLNWEPHNFTKVCQTEPLSRLYSSWPYLKFNNKHKWCSRNLLLSYLSFILNLVFQTSNLARYLAYFNLFKKTQPRFSFVYVFFWDFGISWISLCSVENLLGPINNNKIYENLISIQQYKNESWLCLLDQVLPCSLQTSKKKGAVIGKDVLRQSFRGKRRERMKDSPSEQKNMTKYRDKQIFSFFSFF